MPPSVAEFYHAQTKYTPEGLQKRSRGLDFSRQPVPFKAYATGESLDLTDYLPDGDELRSDQALADWRAGLPPAERAMAEVSHLLYLTNGVTAVIPHPGQPFFMRAAPSAGGLYPTEIYLAAKGHAGLPDGLYNYQVREHALRRFWSEDIWDALREATFDHPALAETDLVVIASAVFERSAWRYEDRAYRRVLLDTGHVLGNLAMVAPWMNRHALAIGGFADDALNDRLFFEGDTEGALAIIALTPSASDTGPRALAGPRTAAREVPEGQRLHALHEASKMSAPSAPVEAAPSAEKYAFAFGESLAAPVPLDWADRLSPTIIERRSTRAFTGDALNRPQLAQLLEFAYRPNAKTSLFAPELLQTFVVVHDVDGLEPGCYHYAPATQSLRQIRFTGLRAEVRYLALGQDLAGTASAVVIHTADLPSAIERYGDRAYRYLHLDAGQLGERLNVGAVRLGLGASGIAGFFDDQVNDLLGIPEREAVVYLTTLGVPEEE